MIKQDCIKEQKVPWTSECGPHKKLWKPTHLEDQSKIGSKVGSIRESISGHYKLMTGHEGESWDSTCMQMLYEIPIQNKTKLIKFWWFSTRMRDCHSTSLMEYQCWGPSLLTGATCGLWTLKFSIFICSFPLDFLFSFTLMSYL